jgi:hypothetical protein
LNWSRRTWSLALRSATRASTCAFFSFAAANVALASATAAFFVPGPRALHNIMMYLFQSSQRKLLSPRPKLHWLLQMRRKHKLMLLLQILMPNFKFF